MNPTRARLEFIENVLTSLRRELLAHNENFMRERGVEVRLRAEHLKPIRPVVALGVFARYADEAENVEFELDDPAPVDSRYERIAPRLSWSQFHWAIVQARVELARMMIPDAQVIIDDAPPPHPHLLPNEAIN